MKSRTFFWLIILAIVTLIVWGKIAKKTKKISVYSQSYSQLQGEKGHRQSLPLRRRKVARRKKGMREIFLHLSGPVTIPLGKRERIVVGLNVPASFILTREDDPYWVINMGNFPVKRIFLNRRTDHRWFCYSVQNPYGYEVNLLIASPDWELPLKFGR